jgi:hypothetical protein
LINSLNSLRVSRATFCIILTYYPVVRRLSFNLIQRITDRESLVTLAITFVKSALDNKPVIFSLKKVDRLINL